MYEGVPADVYRVPLDRANVLHHGNDVTVAAFSYMAMEALFAARALASQSVGIDVIDMRSVRPLDMETVTESVRRTGRLLVADTAFKTGSVAAELVSLIAEREFESLKAAPVRIASPDHPVPTSHFMSEKYYPDSLAIADAVLSLAGIRPDAIDYAQLRQALGREGPHDAPNKNFAGPF